MKTLLPPRTSYCVQGTEQPESFASRQRPDASSAVIRSGRVRRDVDCMHIRVIAVCFQLFQLLRVGFPLCGGSATVNIVVCDYQFLYADTYIIQIVRGSGAPECPKGDSLVSAGHKVIV